MHPTNNLYNVGFFWIKETKFLSFLVKMHKNKTDIIRCDLLPYSIVLKL